MLFPVHVASIVHLTDLHLFLDHDGNMRTPAQRALGARILRAIFGGVAHGLDIADGPAWTALRRRLRAIVQVETGFGARCVIVQTGDVEAYGMSPGGHFTGWHDLHERLWSELAAVGADHVDIYGNHDIWPGTFPLLAGKQAHQELELLPAFVGAWPAEVTVTTDGGLRLRFHRINTVLGELFRGGLLAQGGVGPHPIPDAWNGAEMGAAIGALRASIAGDPVRPALNLLLMHHPPHLFDPELGTTFTTGQLHGRYQLCDSLAGQGVGLVLAGHRHRMNPAYGALPPHEQLPLPAGVHQLVASSPTVVAPDRSLSLYRIHWEPGSPTATLDRLVFDYTAAGGLEHEPRFEPGLMEVPVLVGGALNEDG